MEKWKKLEWSKIKIEKFIIKVIKVKIFKKIYIYLKKYFKLLLFELLIVIDIFFK
jgi:hypothetical protein